MLSLKWLIQLFRLTLYLVAERIREDWITSARCAFGATLLRWPIDGSSQWLVDDMHVRPHGPHLDLPLCPSTLESHQRCWWRQDALRHIALPRFVFPFVSTLKARFLARTWTCLTSIWKTIRWMGIVCTDCDTDCFNRQLD